MAITYDGALHFGPEVDATRYYAGAMPTTPTGDLAIFAILRVPYFYDGADPSLASNNPIPIAANFLTGSGGGGNDCYIQFIAGGNGTGGNNGKIRAQLRSGSTWFNVAAASITGTSNFQVGDTILVVLQSNAGTWELKTCKLNGTVVTEATSARNSLFTAKALGTWNWGRTSTSTTPMGAANVYQAAGMINRALTDTEIANIAAGTDLESIVAAPDRLALWLFNSKGATIPATWGATALTQNGTWTNTAVASPVIPNAAQRIAVTNEPGNYGAVGCNFDGSAPTHTWQGTYVGFTPATLQARIMNLDGTVAQDWTSLGSFTASAGTWSGTLSVPLGGLYRLEVRDSVATTVVYRGFRAWSCCPVIESMGQSPHVYLERVYKGTFTLVPTNCYLRYPGINQLVKAVTANVGAGLARALNQWSTVTGGRPIVVLLNAVGGTSSGDWGGRGATTWTDFLAALDHARPGRVLLTWLNGSDDSTYNAATIKANHDTIITNLDADLTTTRGIAYRYRMIPHNRQTSGTAGGQHNVRQAQFEWARDHPQFGTKVFHGPQWLDMQTDSEATGTAQGGAASSITLAANDEADAANLQTRLSDAGGTNNLIVEIIAGTGSGQSRIAATSGYNATTKVLPVTVAWTTVPDATSVYRIYKGTPHPANLGGVASMGARYGQDLAAQYALSATTGRGPTVVSVTYPNGGDGSLLDVALTHRHGTGLLTPNGGNVAGFEVSTDGGTNFAAPVSAVITGPNTVRLTLASAPANKANLRVRYGYGFPIPQAQWATPGAGIGDLLYDNVAIGPTGGLPVAFTTSDLTPTEAPPGAGGGVLATTGAFAA